LDVIYQCPFKVIEIEPHHIVLQMHLYVLWTVLGFVDRSNRYRTQRLYFKGAPQAWPRHESFLSLTFQVSDTFLGLTLSRAPILSWSHTPFIQTSFLWLNHKTIWSPIHTSHHKSSRKRKEQNAKLLDIVSRDLEGGSFL